MPSVVRAGLFAYVCWQRINVRYIHNGREHKAPMCEYISRYVLRMRLQRYYIFLNYARKMQNKNDLSSRTGHFH